MTTSIYFTFLAARNLLNVVLYFAVHRQVLVGHLHNNTHTHITHQLYGKDFTNNIKQYQVFMGMPVSILPTTLHAYAYTTVLG